MNHSIQTLRVTEFREQAVEQAAALLRAGGLAILPTETMYAIAADARNPAAMDRLWNAKGSRSRAPLSWHVESGETLLKALSELAYEVPPAHRRAVRVLLPGPVTLAIELTADRLQELRRRLRLGAGVIDDGSMLLARVPERLVTREILERAQAPIVMATLGTPPAHTPSRAREDALNLELFDEILLIDDGPATYTQPSTLLRLAADGSVRVDREGAIDERTIHKRMSRTLLFVCTGNTCRSPMAAAIARHLLARMSGVGTKVRSAGVAAGFGSAATPEGEEALRELGIEMGPHASAPLTREHINEAEAIYVMTRSHLEAVLRFDPTVRDRVMLLDPEGHDIPDPIGGPPELYRSTAEILRKAVERRLRELPE